MSSDDGPWLPTSRTNRPTTRRPRPVQRTPSQIQREAVIAERQRALAQRLRALTGHEAPDAEYVDDDEDPAPEPARPLRRAKIQLLDMRRPEHDRVREEHMYTGSEVAEAINDQREFSLFANDPSWFMMRCCVQQRRLTHPDDWTGPCVLFRILKDAGITWVSVDYKVARYDDLSIDFKPVFVRRDNPPVERRQNPVAGTLDAFGLRVSTEEFARLM